MRVALITPWENAWVPLYREAVERRGHSFEVLKKPIAAEFDVAIHGWMHDRPMFTGMRNVMFLRRFELFENVLPNVMWGAVNHLICVNTWIARVVSGIFKENAVKTPVSTIYNAADLRRWKWKERKGNNMVGMACHVHPKKNLPLALQVMAWLPPEYELHIAGAIQDGCTAEYLNHMAKRLRRKVYLYGHIPAEGMSLWWEQMGVCLSTSLSEGNPNNVIEAMAKGIKPVVHGWPGAEDQFPEYIFDTAQQAAAAILDPTYDSAGYRRVVEERFSVANIERVLDIAFEEAA